MVHDFHSSPKSDEDEELGDDFYNRQVLMFLDALVFADVSDDKEVRCHAQIMYGAYGCMVACC
jgi:hypothetical protein